MEGIHHLEPANFFTSPLSVPRRSALSAPEREQLLVLPESPEEFIRQYTFSEAAPPLIQQHRGVANRLGFAVQLCYLRFPELCWDRNGRRAWRCWPS